MDSGFNLSASSASRIGKMLRDYENGRLGRRPDPGQVTPSVGVGNSFVKVTGTNAAYPAGDYVGEFTWFDTSDGLWHSQFDPVRVREVNGATLTVGSKYVGEYVETIAGIEVFAVQASGGGAAGSSLIIVKLTNTIAMTGLQQTYNPTTKGWTDGVITLNLVEINGNTMPVNKRMPALLISGTTYAVGLDPAAVTSVTCAGGSLTVAGRN